MAALIHADGKTDKKDNACSICQISHQFSKSLTGQGIEKIQPLRSFERLKDFSSLVISANQISSHDARGPPSKA
ncbi:MAG: hypothetical protein U1F57_10120 [bacterium]